MNENARHKRAMEEADTRSPEELEAAAEIYNRLVDGTLYAPGTKFVQLCPTCDRTFLSEHGGPCSDCKEVS